MATRVLILNRQLVFAVTIKQALEQTGAFDVHPFTTPEAAFDYLRDHPQDVALVDFTLPGGVGARVVRQLRAIQADLAVIISPRQPPGETRSLNIQGMIDTPFSARDIIPLIEQSVNLIGQTPTTNDDLPPALPRTKPAASGPVTRILDESPSDPPSPGKTRIFADEPAQPPATTRHLEESDVGKNEPAETRRLDEAAQPHAPAPTRKLDEEDAPSPPSPMRRRAQTIPLDDDQPPVTKPKRRSSKTRNLDEPPVPPTENWEQTRRFDEPPPDLPEFSALDEVLKSFGLDPPTLEDDTPAVPTTDSGAVRQFLATSGQPEVAHEFDNILGAINADDVVEAQPRTETDFEGLVASMRSDEPHKPLPNRQQQTFEFVLTSSMDELLSEIKKTQTGPLAPPVPPEFEDSKTFQKLAEEEPPMPTLEESGTVSDLMLGVSDTGFRNVLAMLRGEDVEEGRPGRAISPAERDEMFAAFFGPPAAREPAVKDTAPAQPEPPEIAGYTFDHLVEDEPGEESVAHVVLKTTLDDTQLPGDFSLNKVITDIENRLAIHKLNIRPLPSWDMDTTQFRTLSESGVIEPDFLRSKKPEDLPEFPPLEKTTQATAAVQEALSRPSETSDTPLDLSYLDLTIPSKAVHQDKSAEEELPPPPELPAEPTQVEEKPDLAEAWSDLPAEEWPTEEWSLPPEMSPEEVGLIEEPATDETWPEQVELIPAAPEATEPETEPRRPPAFIGIEDEAGIDALEIEAEPEAIATEWDEIPDVARVETEPQPELISEWDQAPAEAEIVEAPIEAAVPEDPYIAQLALHLTQVSLELSAEETILTREGEIVAVAGHLDADDIQELRRVINNDWEANAQGARVRFVTLPSSGRDYMLYSIRTENELTLSMIFAGTTPLRAIRQQGQRLKQALQAVPEIAVEDAPSVIEIEKEETGLVQSAPALDKPFGSSGTGTTEVITNSYACVWLLRDPNAHLEPTLVQAITTGLSTQLQEQGWVIRQLTVEEDYIYLLGDVPGEITPQQIIRNLKRRSADIAHAQNPDLTPQMLWADSYLVLTPGRELEIQEIQGFINFQRTF